MLVLCSVCQSLRATGERPPVKQTHFVGGGDLLDEIGKTDKTMSRHIVTYEDTERSLRPPSSSNTAFKFLFLFFQKKRKIPLPRVVARLAVAARPLPNWNGTPS